MSIASGQSNYPNGFDLFPTSGSPTLSYVVDQERSPITGLITVSGTPIRGIQVNSVYTILQSVEQTLGINPQGNFKDVASRINSIATSGGTTVSGNYLPISGGTLTGSLAMAGGSPISGVSQLNLTGQGINITNTAAFSDLNITNTQAFGGVNIIIGDSNNTGGFQIKTTQSGSLVTGSVAPGGGTWENYADSIMFPNTNTVIFPSTSGTVTLGTPTNHFNTIYVDHIVPSVGGGASGNFVHITGDTMTGPLYVDEISNATLGYINISGSVIEGLGGVVDAGFSHAEGYQNTANGGQSHAEGYQNGSHGQGSHAEGFQTVSSQIGSHSEGYGSQAIGPASHAEGFQNIVSAQSAHGEGQSNNIGGSATGAHAEGFSNGVNGVGSHAGGFGSQVNGDYSFLHGWGSSANGIRSVVIGGSGIAAANGSWVFADSEFLTSTNNINDSLLMRFSGGVALDSGTSLYATIANTQNIGSAGIPFENIYVNNINSAEVNFSVFNEVPTGLINSSNKTYFLVNTPVLGSERVFASGLRQYPIGSYASYDYSVSGNAIVFVGAPNSGTRIMVDYNHT